MIDAPRRGLEPCGRFVWLPSETMFEHLSELEAELDRLEAELPEILASGDRRAARDAGRRYAELRPVVDAYRRWRHASQEIGDAAEMLQSETDPEMREYLSTELDAKEHQRAGLEAEIKELLIPRDPNEGRNVIVEIQGT
ncbi:MAG TPA: PCRF domain-containing protein, partial [Acidimicrobiia bacterium]|nr:PCRF domain-containing protein [Acidimicrobiia bacterium]